MTEECIAKITSTHLGWEDHGILTCWVYLNYGGSSQGAGGYAFDEPVRDEEGVFQGRVGTAFGMQFIAGIMKAAGVRRWEDLPGRTVFAIVEDGLVRGIKPLPTEGGVEFRFDSLQKAEVGRFTNG